MSRFLVPGDHDTQRVVRAGGVVPVDVEAIGTEVANADVAAVRIQGLAPMPRVA